MGLDPQTEQRLRELFGGRQCCRCGRPAERLIDDQYYCQPHFLDARRGPRAGPNRAGPPAGPRPRPGGSGAADTAA
jgi:hypothetical protein